MSRIGKVGRAPSAEGTEIFHTAEVVAHWDVVTEVEGLSLQKLHYFWVQFIKKNSKEGQKK
jgi:hypothetical protein